ncbi:MAG: tRNA pseudouridine(38-40) synthase TruA [Myxococcota bacterium]
MNTALPMRTVTWRLWVAYRGEDFCGFQNQHHQRTVQGVLESALSRLAHEPVAVGVAGRTDAGVHAWGQAVSCRMNTQLDGRKLVLALSHLLPKDVSVWQADEMPDAFHARQHSIGKRYIYRIEQTLAPCLFSPWPALRVLHTLDVTSMQQAAQHLVGDHDFSSFRAASCTASHARRFVWKIQMQRKLRGVWIDVRGNAFCHHMVRILVGTLLQVGRGKLSVDDVQNILQARCRQRAGPTAPACGLTLQQVYYPDNLWQACIPQHAHFPRYPVTTQTWPCGQVRSGPVLAGQSAGKPVRWQAS